MTNSSLCPTPLTGLWSSWPRRGNPPWLPFNPPVVTLCSGVVPLTQPDKKMVGRPQKIGRWGINQSMQRIDQGRHRGLPLRRRWVEMKYDSTIHKRRSIRLSGYDYSQAGMYFVTICTQLRICLFGEIADGKGRLNDAGKMVQTVWNEIPIYYPGIKTDEFVIMPNHIHSIVVIMPPVGATPRGCPSIPRNFIGPSIQKNGGAPPKRGHVADRPGQARGKAGQAQGPTPTGAAARQGIGGRLSLPDVVHRFKTMTTKRYADGVKHKGWQPFPGKLWQRNYWEHIIRSEPELNGLREYIQNNPARWTLDRLYVAP